MRQCTGYPDFTQNVWSNMQKTNKQQQQIVGTREKNMSQCMAVLIKISVPSDKHETDCRHRVNLL